MKRLVLVALVVFAIAAPATAQARLDIGVLVPKGFGIVSDGEASGFSDAADFLSKYIIPLPEATLAYQFDLGTIKLGVGARAFTVVLATMAWPNVFAEWELGPIILDAQVGGGIFGWYAISTGGIEAGKVFLPDLSAWFAVGKKKILRLGGGATGLFLPEIDSDTVPVILYFAGKASIML
jgi:hypothetical protein